MQCGGKIILDPVTFGKPCISLAVSAKKQEKRIKSLPGCAGWKRKTRLFTVAKNPETGDMLVSGMGELHIEAICNKLKNKFGVEAALKGAQSRLSGDAAQICRGGGAA